MTPNLRKILTFLLPLAFLPYVLVCFYNNPNADDFLFGNLGRENDFFGTWLQQYNTWSGRYTSNFFVLAGPLKWGSFRLYKFIPLVILVLHWFSIKFFLKSLVGKHISKPELHLCTYLLVLLFIYQMPTISEGLYWYTGAVTYFLGCISTTLYLALLIRFWQGKFIFNNRFLHIGLVTLLIFITAGFNEVLMLMMNVFAVTLLLALIRHELPNKGLAVYLVLITAAASCLLFFAPGNTVRNAQFPKNHDFFYSFLLSLAQTCRFFVTWVFSAPLWIMSFAYYFLHARLIKEVKLFRESFYLSIGASTNLLFIVIFISVFPAYWATGMLGQHRTLNVAYYFFILIWFINLTVWFNWAELELVQIRQPKRKITIVLFMILLGCFLFVKNGYYTTADIISGRAKNFDMKMNERYELMKSANDTIHFTSIKNPPKSLSFYEVTSDPNHWLNICWVNYFGREGKAVVVRKD